MMFQKQTEYVVFSLLFILFGMALFAAAVNLFVLRFMATTSDNESLDKPRMKTIVLRGFSQDNTLDVSQGRSSIADMGHLKPLTDGGSLRIPVTTVRNRRDGRGKGLVCRYISNPSEQNVKTFGRCWYCYSRILRRLGFGHRPRYTVRRAPTRISHLLNPNSVVPDIILSPSTEIMESTESQPNSIMMHDIRRISVRRPSL